MATLTIDKSWLNWVTSHESASVVRPSSLEFEQDAARADAFRRAYQDLIDDGTLGQLVAIHGNMSHQQHSMPRTAGSLRFLPWHRVFLYLFEAALRTKDWSIVVPYWDWVQDRAIPEWVSTYTPDVPVPAYFNKMAGLAAGEPVTSHVHHVTRDPGETSDFLGSDTRDGLPTAEMADMVAKQPSFTGLTTPVRNPHSKYISPFGLEGLHNGVHDWVGGTMAGVGSASGIGESPADVLFWLHHANIDRMWAQWQASHNDHPALVGTNAQLDPWYDASTNKLTEKDTRSISLLDYTYR